MKKNIIITGASRGIGFELAKICLKQNHNVAVISRSLKKLSRLEEHQKESELILIPFDLSKTEEIYTIYNKVEHFGKIDLLYNNAGILFNEPFLKISQKAFVESWQVNFLAPAMLIQVLLPIMDSESHIINISTIGAVQGSVKFPGLTAYSSSKAALINLTEILAEELKENGPSINSLALGAVQTEMLSQAFPDYKAEIQPTQMANYLYDFGLNGAKLYNGKVLPVSKSTP